MNPPSNQPVSWGWRLLVGKSPRRTIVRAIVVAVSAAVLFKFILIPMRIAGSSMEPTYGSGGVNFVNRLAYAWKTPSRGDVVAIRMAGSSIMLMKRVVGLPGERVAISRGIVHIDGEPMNEPYVKRTGDWTVGEFTLGADEYFVVGDNRAMSSREHVFGVTPRRRIEGKVVF